MLTLDINYFKCKVKNIVIPINYIVHKMISYHTNNSGHSVAELTDRTYRINEAQDALDLIAEIGLMECNSLIINQANLSPDFFDLKTGLAGEVLQKFSNYRSRLAIIGDFSTYTSKSLNDFIRECNRGKMIFFADSLESALNRLEGS